MNDTQIVQMYFDRNPSALTQTTLKYGNYCICIAKNILGSDEDAEECLNDALHKVWNSIPPQRPENLATYIGKIIRNLSFDRYKFMRTQKRGNGETEVILEEIGNIVSGNDTPENEIDRKELIGEINSFLDTLSKEKRSIFISRYWYAMSVPHIAKKFGKSRANVAVILSRIRNDLKAYLTERGYDI